MNPIRKAFTAIRLHWRTLRLQLALLYAGAFVALGAALLAVSGLLGMEWPDPPIPEVLNSHMSSLGLAGSGERQRAA